MTPELVTNELAKLLGRLHTEEKKELRRFTESKEHLSNIKQQIESVETTIRLCRNGNANADTQDALLDELKKAKARGKSQVALLRIIAARNDNRFKVVDAQRLMLEVGAISNPKHAASIIYTLLNRSGKFGKIKPGEYRVLSKKEAQEREGFTPSEWEAEVQKQTNFL